MKPPHTTLVWEANVKQHKMSEWMREMDENTDSPVGKHYLVLGGCFCEASPSSEPDEDI